MGYYFIRIRITNASSVSHPSATTFFYPFSKPRPPAIRRLYLAYNMG
jgi:hypothetical protein